MDGAVEKVQKISDVEKLMLDMGRAARAASQQVALASTDTKNQALSAMAKALRARSGEILIANAKDIHAAEDMAKPASFIDRLMLDAARIEGIALSIEAIAALDDPIGDILADWDRPNGLNIQRVRVPLGVIGIIYESRPNVTADAGALCLKSGNAVILRGGSDSFHSSAVIHAAMCDGLRSASLPEAAIQLIPTIDRDAVGHLLKGLDGTVDVIVPRGGKSLVARVQEEARVPVFAHLDGICHVYVHKGADLKMAVDIVLNAKMRRTGICGAAETLLVDRAVADSHLAAILDGLISAGCEVRGDDVAQKTDDRVVAATAADWDTEYLEPIISAVSLTVSQLRLTISTSTARITRTALSHPMRPLPGNSSMKSIAPLCCTMPRPSLLMVASLAWGRKSASPRDGCMPAARLVSNSSPASNMSCAEPGRRDPTSWGE